MIETEKRKTGPHVPFYKENGKWNADHPLGWWGEIFSWGVEGSSPDDSFEITVHNEPSWDLPGPGGIFTRMKIYPREKRWTPVRNTDSIVASISGDELLLLTANPAGLGLGGDMDFEFYAVHVPTGAEVDPRGTVRDPGV